ncbi:MAG: antirestriction protein [Porticoccaceae bacterium]|nr:antirestriction protein [Porticoccaceae bacterium]
MNPRIYVGCLAAYNNGKLHGEWIDADQDADDIREEIREILQSSPESQHECHDEECGYKGQCDEDGTCPECGEDWRIAEEWAIHDYEEFGGIKISEYEDIDVVARLGNVLSELDDEDAEGFSAWYDNEGDSDSDSLLDDFREKYRGCWRSIDEYAENFCEDTGMLSDVHDSMKHYINYEAMANDWEMGGDIWTHEGEHGVHVFDNH